MKVGRAKLINKPTTTKGKKYNKFFIYLSTYVVEDKDFPFKEDEELLVKIENGKLVVTKS
jgi:phage terminase large subunit-like protein